MLNAWVDWLSATGVALLGIIVRLSHGWSQHKQGQEGAKPITARDVVAAVIAAPLLGIMAYGLGSYLKLSGEATGALCGFAGLLGPAALITAWDKISDAALHVFKSWGGRGGGGSAE